MSLFDPNLVYPSDENGEYMNLEGDVVEVVDKGHEWLVRILVPGEGILNVWTDMPPIATAAHEIHESWSGYKAGIKIYKTTGRGPQGEDNSLMWWKAPTEVES